MDERIKKVVDGEYGSVSVISGPYKGLIGYYDEDTVDVPDDFDDRCNACPDCGEYGDEDICDKHDKEWMEMSWIGLVYKDVPCLSDYVLVSHQDMVYITSLEYEKFKKNNSKFCKIARIP